MGTDVPPLPLPPPPSSERASAARWNKKAVWSFICGVAGIYPFPIICSVVALALGYSARKAIDLSPMPQRGRGLAIAGIVLGWATLGLCVAIFVLYGVACMSGPDC